MLLALLAACGEAPFGEAPFGEAAAGDAAAPESSDFFFAMAISLRRAGRDRQAASGNVVVRHLLIDPAHREGRI
ncbi:MAG: hypothetical protein L0Y71_14970 [Gemmataceae bacterium]|nr:hypothetical protein [Gemmataceae bacterium]